MRKKEVDRLSAECRGVGTDGEVGRALVGGREGIFVARADVVGSFGERASYEEYGSDEEDKSDGEETTVTVTVDPRALLERVDRITVV